MGECRRPCRNLRFDVLDFDEDGHDADEESHHADRDGKRPEGVL